MLRVLLCCEQSKGRPCAHVDRDFKCELRTLQEPRNVSLLCTVCGRVVCVCCMCEWPTAVNHPLPQTLSRPELESCNPSASSDDSARPSAYLPILIWIYIYISTILLYLNLCLKLLLFPQILFSGICVKRARMGRHREWGPHKNKTRASREKLGKGYTYITPCLLHVTILQYFKIKIL